MKMKQTLRTWPVMIGFITALAAPAGANDVGWTDFFPDKDFPDLQGIQSGSWRPLTSLTIYTDDLGAADKASLIAGIRAWSDRLCGISVVFKDGNAPDNLTDEQKKSSVQIQRTDQSPGTSGELALTSVTANLPAGQNHGTLEGPATIAIFKDILDRGWSDLLKNTGTHEFGHLLGLDDSAPFQNPVPDGYQRVRAMDPNFTATSGYLAPTKEEWQLLSRYYCVPDSTPPTAWLLIAILACLWTIRRTGRQSPAPVA